jgi:hypothetical protein
VTTTDLVPLWEILMTIALATLIIYHSCFFGKKNTVFEVFVSEGATFEIYNIVTSLSRPKFRAHWKHSRSWWPTDLVEYTLGEMTCFVYVIFPVDLIQSCMATALPTTATHLAYAYSIIF